MLCFYFVFSVDYRLAANTYLVQAADCGAGGACTADSDQPAPLPGCQEQVGGGGAGPADCDQPAPLPGDQEQVGGCG